MKMPILGVAVLFAVSACQTQPAFKDGAAPSLRISTVEVTPPGPNNFWWAEREDGAFAPTNCPKESLAGSNNPIAYDKETSITNCVNAAPLAPDAKSEVRREFAEIVKGDLEKSVLPNFTGTRETTLRVALSSLMTVSAAQTLLVGGGHSLSGTATLIDAVTGETLAASDLASGAGGGGGLIGVAFESGKVDPAYRLSQGFAKQTCIWISGSDKTCR